MKQFSLIVIILGFISVDYSQDTTSTWKKTPPFVLSVDFFGGLGSTNMTNEFTSKLIFGGHIDSTLKNNVLDNTKKMNRAGFELNYEVKFYNMQDTFLRTLPDYRYYIGIGSYANTSASFTQDFFKTIFYGNASFGNTPAVFDNTTLFQSNFKKISFGLMNLKTKTSFALSIISGNNHQLFDFNTARLTTGEDANELTFEYDGNFQQSDSIANGFLKFSGAGIALDYSMHIKETVQLSITNLGFALWARNPSSARLNETINYDGFYVSNVFSENSFNVSNSLDSIIPNIESKAFVSFLPAIIEAKKVINTDKELQLNYGLRYRFMSNYFPYLYIGGFYNATEQLKLSSALSYGGYNAFEMNFNAYYSTNTYYIGVGTNNLLGNFSKKGRGRSLLLSAMIKF